MLLSIRKTHGLYVPKLFQRPIKASGGILSAGKTYQRTLILFHIFNHLINKRSRCLTRGRTFRKKNRRKKVKSCFLRGVQAHGRGWPHSWNKSNSRQTRISDLHLSAVGFYLSATKVMIFIPKIKKFRQPAFLTRQKSIHKNADDTIRIEHCRIYPRASDRAVVVESYLCPAQ